MLAAKVLFSRENRARSARTYMQSDHAQLSPLFFHWFLSKILMNSLPYKKILDGTKLKTFGDKKYIFE